MKRNKIIVALSLLACTLLSCQNEKKQSSSATNESKMEKNDTILKPFVAENLFWTREPKQHTITDSLSTSTRCVHSTSTRATAKSRSEYMPQVLLTIHSQPSSLKWKWENASGRHGRLRIQALNKHQNNPITRPTLHASMA